MNQRKALALSVLNAALAKKTGGTVVEMKAPAPVVLSVQGKDGQRGPRGFRGLDGEQGPQGVKGDTGAPGIVWRGQYKASTRYKPGDGVRLHRSSWICLKEHTGREPSATNKEFWDLIAVGGLDGRDGSEVRSAVFGSAIAGENLQQFQAVEVRADGRIYAADPLTLDVASYAGVIMENAFPGQRVELTRSGNISGYEGAGPVFITDGGFLSFDPPTAGSVVQVGVAVGGFLFLNISASVQIVE